LICFKLITTLGTYFNYVLNLLKPLNIIKQDCSWYTFVYAMTLSFIISPKWPLLQVT